MSSVVLARESSDASWSLSNYESVYDVQVNALSVDQLFELYERAGFLYPAKAARLAPHLDTVRENWRRLLQVGDSLLYVLTAGDERDGYASVAVWRTTRDSWVWQHLVSEGHPLQSRAVMLGGLVRCVRHGIGESQQNWFRPENRFPARVFGSMVQSVGESCSSVQRHMFFAVPRQARVPDVGSVQIVPYDPGHHEGLRTVAARSRGGIYIASEDLDGDPELLGVNALYRRAGLSRTRRIWLAYRRGSREALGAAMAYRGPLGLNFSFLENRCDLLLDPALSDTEAATVSRGLVGASMEAYADFELEEIPFVADEKATAALCAVGGQFLRNYSQGIWLKDGQPRLYGHVDRFYSRLINRAGRRGVPSSLIA